MEVSPFLFILRYILRIFAENKQNILRIKLMEE